MAVMAEMERMQKAAMVTYFIVLFTKNITGDNRCPYPACNRVLANNMTLVLFLVFE